MMPSVKIKELLLTASLCAILIAQSAWALTIHVTPTANPQTTLADLNNNPNTPVTLTQALAILKDPALRTPSAPVAASAATVLPPARGG